MKIPKGGRLSKAQQQAFDGLEKTNNSYFIYGAAGSGKSSFIDYFRNNPERNISKVKNLMIFLVYIILNILQTKI